MVNSEMKSGVLITILILIVVASGVYFFWQNGSTYQLPGDEDNSNQIAVGEPNPATGENSGNEATSESNAVEISGYSFSPSTLTINAGDGVTWTNLDSAPHTITSDSGNELGSGTLSKGGSYSHTFTTAGTYAYHCGVHASMKGTIIVE